MSKYEVPDGHWDKYEEKEAEADGGPPVTVDHHEVSVILTTDPTEDMGYGREKYDAIITYGDDRGPEVLYVVEHRWKGNYWRDTTNWDWQDVPGPVRHKVASLLPVDGPEDLESGVRLIDEGGESRWEKIHKPRMEAMSGDEMWATSFLRDAHRYAEKAAEAADDGSEAEARAEEIVAEIQDAVEFIEVAEVGDGDGQ